MNLCLGYRSHHCPYGPSPDARLVPARTVPPPGLTGRLGSVGRASSTTPAFDVLVDNDVTRTALDAIFGPGPRAPAPSDRHCAKPQLVEHRHRVRISPVRTLAKCIV